MINVSYFDNINIEAANLNKCTFIENERVPNFYSRKYFKAKIFYAYQRLSTKVQLL